MHVNQVAGAQTLLSLSHPPPSFSCCLPTEQTEMLFTLILLQARHLSLGVLGAVGFNHPDCFASDFPHAQRRESESKLAQKHPPSSLLPLTQSLQSSSYLHWVNSEMQCSVLAGSAPSWRIKVKSIDPGDLPWLGPAFWE